MKLKYLLVMSLIIVTCFAGIITGCAGKQEGLLPVFSTGDQWVSRWYTGGIEYTVTAEITGEETIDGRGCYVMEMTFEPTYMDMLSGVTNKYDKETLNIVTMDMHDIRPGEFTSIIYQISGGAFYPVTVGKEITEVEFKTVNSGNDMVAQTENSTTTTRTVVEKVEKITVEAGTFECFKLLKYDESGNLIQVAWRSNDTKMFQVKLEDPMEPDAVYELLSYKVH